MPLILRFGASTGLALAVVCLPLLPPEHIHRTGIEGRTVAIAHAHPLGIMGGAGCGTSLTRPHGDHSLAVFLTSAFDDVRGGLSQPMLASATPVRAPERRPIRVLAAQPPQSTHGPPGFPWLTRGPPRSR